MCGLRATLEINLRRERLLTLDGILGNQPVAPGDVELSVGREAGAGEGWGEAGRSEGGA